MPHITVRRRFFRANLIGFAGLAVAGGAVLQDGSYQSVGPFLRCAAGGAFLAGLLLAGLFGRRGCKGGFLAGLGVSAVTVLGVLFGVVLLPLEAMALNGRTEFTTLLSPISWGWGVSSALAMFWGKAGLPPSRAAAMIAVHGPGRQQKGQAYVA